MRTLLFISFIIFVSPSFAFTDGGSTMKLSSILAEIKKHYKVVMDQLEEARAANNTMRQIYEVSGEVYDEYKFIQDFSSESEIRRITRDIQGLTGLTGWNDTDDEGKFKLLRAEIKRRFKNEPEKAQEMENQISELERLEALKQQKLEEAAAAGAGDMNDKNLNSSVASSTALLTAIQISEQQKQLQEQMAREEQANDAKEYEDSFIQFLDNAK